MSQDITSSVARLSYKGDAFVNVRLSAARRRDAAVGRVLARKAEETIVLASQFMRNFARSSCISLLTTEDITRQ